MVGVVYKKGVFNNGFISDLSGNGDILRKDKIIMENRFVFIKGRNQVKPIMVAHQWLLAVKRSKRQIILNNFVKKTAIPENHKSNVFPSGKELRKECFIYKGMRRFIYG